MIIEAEQFGLRIGFGHDDGGRAMAAADIRNARPPLQFRLHSLQRRNPRADQIRVVTRAGRISRCLRTSCMVLVPAYALTGFEGVLQFVQVARHRTCGDEKSRQVSGAVFIRQRECLFGCRANTVLVPGSYVTYPLAALALSHSWMYRAWVPVCCASSAGVTGPAFAMALNKPSFSPMTTSDECMAAPISFTALPKNASSLDWINCRYCGL